MGEVEGIFKIARENRNVYKQLQYRRLLVIKERHVYRLLLTPPNRSSPLFNFCHHFSPLLGPYSVWKYIYFDMLCYI